MLSHARLSMALSALVLIEAAGAQSPPAQTSAPPAPQAETLAQKPGTVLITLDQAIQMALQHNHNLLANKTVVQQSKAEETTANLRPNPVLLSDAIFLPVFQPSNLTPDYLDNVAQWDLGVSYLFERGKKRQHRLRFAQDQTGVAQSQEAASARLPTP
jgi:cobalt-zinc-cadmium efflux system outer membrane protein